MFDLFGDQLIDPMAMPGRPVGVRGFVMWLMFHSPAAAALSLVTTGFWVWMLAHCYRYEPDRSFWLWIMILFPPSCLAYFVARWLTAHEGQAPSFLHRVLRRRELERLETATVQIGNPHQFIVFGDALRDAGQHDRAKAAYLQALERDASNIQALWGAASVDLHQRHFAEAGERLRKVLQIDPQYKFGDVSLAYARVLYETREHAAAVEHLLSHVQRWRQPEALYLLATLYAEQGRPREARETLQALLLDIRACPGAIARRYGMWKSKANKLLKKLPTA